MNQAQLIQIRNSALNACIDAIDNGRRYSPLGFNLFSATNRIARNTARRRRIGWFDFCIDSYDMQGCRARAYRIQQRLIGNRLSFYQAMWG